MKIQNFLILTVILLFTLPSTKMNAQQKSTPLTPKEQKIAIDSIGNKLNANYIFPEVAKKMVENMQSKFKNGDYKSVIDPREFAKQLTADLLSVSNDKHIGVHFNPEEIASEKQTKTPEDSLIRLNNYINYLKRENFGFKEVKILNGNIGYLDLRSFSDVEHAGPTAVSTMNFLSNSDAIIIDLRMNGGGSPEMIQLITSYLFDNKPVHLNNFYWRPTDINTQSWTLPYVQGTRSPKTPIYILTSKNTFSAAEEFAYNLKNLKRATLIGETTGGGAHPGGIVIATDQFAVWIPSGRAINPITNTNWEGTGVTPDIKIPANKALEVAQIKALETLLEENKDDEELKKIYSWNLSGVKVLNEPKIIDTAILKSYIGNYGSSLISINIRSLYYQQDNESKDELIPLNESEFLIKDKNYLRIRFVLENGKVTGLERYYDNGYSEMDLKN